MDDLIRKLSEIRSEYNCFDKDEESYYSALSEVIRILSRRADGDTISRNDAIDAVKRNTFRLTFAEEQNCEGHVAWSAEAVYSDVMESELLELPSALPEIIRCKYCMHSKHWYKDKRRCFLWHEEGIDVFEDGYCNYAKRRMRGEQDE